VASCEEDGGGWRRWPVGEFLGLEAGDDLLGAMSETVLNIEVMVLDKRRNKMAIWYSMGAEKMVREDPLDPNSRLLDPDEHTLSITRQSIPFRLRARLSPAADNGTTLSFDMEIKTVGWATNMEFTNMLLECLQWWPC